MRLRGFREIDIVDTTAVNTTDGITDWEITAEILIELSPECELEEMASERITSHLEVTPDNPELTSSPR